MISIITCSKFPQAADLLRENIAQTIGQPFELIVVDNKENKLGICSAYNEGGALARFPILCFVHEDVSFVTGGWGKCLIDHLADSQAGLIGVAGGDTRGLVPSGWWIPISSNEMHLIQHYRVEKKQEPQRLLVSSAMPRAISCKVAALDGVFLATRSEVFNQFKFDEEAIEGFHGYDIDYALQVGTKYKVLVVFDILLHHYSEGNQNEAWVRSARTISRKWKHLLPVSVSPAATYENLNLHHWHSLRIYMETLYLLGYKKPVIWYGYLKYSFNQFFNLRRFLSLSKFIFLTLPKRRRTPNPLNHSCAPIS